MNRLLIVAVLLGLSWPGDAVARLRCPKGTKPASVREKAGLLRFCAKPRDPKHDEAIRHGPARAYHRKGNRRWFGAYVDGLLDGPYQAWKRGGGKKAVGAYLQGQRHGAWRLWFRNSLDRGPYVHGEKHGAWVTELYDGGRIEGGYDNGRQHGPWLTLDKEGRKTGEEHYNLGQPDLTWRGWHDNRKLWLEGSWASGRKVGVWRSWHRNGQLESQGAYVDGRREGPYVEQHANGKLRARGQHRQGRRVGDWIFGYDNGVQRAMGRYADDRRVGKWRHLDLDGTPLREVDWDTIRPSGASSPNERGRSVGLPDTATPSTR